MYHKRKKQNSRHHHLASGVIHISMWGLLTHNNYTTVAIVLSERLNGVTV